MILGDRVGHFLQQDRLARTRRSDDQSALPLADRGDDVDDSHAEIAAGRLELDALVGISGPEIVEDGPRHTRCRRGPVDGVDPQKREISLPLLRRTQLAPDRISSPQLEALDLRRRDVDIVGPCEIAPFLAAQESVALVQDLEHPVGVQHGSGAEQMPLDTEDDVLLPQTRSGLDVQVVGELLELRDGLPLQLNSVHGARALLRPREENHSKEKGEGNAQCNRGERK